MEPRKLKRSYKDKIIGGVAGGLGDYFATDPLIFRILFIVLLFTGGGGFLIYILMWIFIPMAPKLEDRFDEPVNKEEKPVPEFEKEKSNNGKIIGGSILILIGLFFLLDNLWPWLDFRDLWPVALVIAGLAIVKMNYPGNKDKKEDSEIGKSVEP